ncbi:hypothetical protein GCM10010301_27770 [Streptomyces plicatus]|nr:hypothetical protein GCM10010301_27770 [Streptomyces plicatus]
MGSASPVSRASCLAGAPYSWAATHSSRRIARCTDPMSVAEGGSAEAGGDGARGVARGCAGKAGSGTNAVSAVAKGHSRNARGQPRAGNTGGGYAARGVAPASRSGL